MSKRKKNKNRSVPVLVARIVDGNYMVIAERDQGSHYEIEQTCREQGLVEDGDYFEWPVVDDYNWLSKIYIGYIIKADPYSGILEDEAG